MMWIALDPRVDSEALGFLPLIFSETDPRPAREQAEDRYAHGGGWDPQPGWVINVRTGEAKYPGDPVILPVAAAILNEEKLLLYPMSYVCVVQPDGSYEMARMD